METDWNAEGRYTSQAFHLRLNAMGIIQAEAMATRLESIPFEVFYSSDQLRAIETSIIIATKQSNLKAFVTDHRLREVNTGICAGMIMTKVVNPIFQTRHPAFDYRSIGGECRMDVLTRQRSFLVDLKNNNDTSERLIVGHGTALRVLLEDMGITETLTRNNFIRIEI
jgi:broad specificity phosphatase PhoE